MATKIQKKVKKLSDDQKISNYKKEYEKWLSVLDVYHANRFDKNYRQYTAYASTKGTKTKISDPIASELIEKVIQKLFERQPKFFTLARGQNLHKYVTDTISSIAEYYWTNPETIQDSGTRKSILKKGAREFMVVGNLATESFYNPDTDNPDFRIIPIEDVIFNPSKTLKTSDTYYIRSYVTLDYLKKRAEIIRNKDVESGIFKNIKKLEEDVKSDEEIKEPVRDDDERKITRAGSPLYVDQIENIELITIVEDQQVTQVANWKHIIREVNDPLGIEGSAYDFAMDIEIVKQPYAYSLLDFINGLTTAKDLILNQTIDYGAKALNPPLFADPNIDPVNRATLANAWRTGGLVMVNSKDANHQPMPQIPSVGFDLMQYIQQRAESNSGIGAYLGGVPNQASDKTQGTKGGIEALINQAMSPLRDRQINLEESIIEPMINKWLKMAGHLMSDNEIKYVFISGETPKWIKVTKGLLTGKVTLDDLLTAELIKEEEAQELGNDMINEGKDPAKDLAFDVDWVIRVEAGSLAEVDKEAELEKLERWVAFNAQFGVQQDMQKISKEMAHRIDLKEPEQYLQTKDGIQQGSMPGQPQRQPQPGLPPQQPPQQPPQLPPQV